RSLQLTIIVAKLDNKVWSLHGAPWLQLATTGCRSHCLKKRGNKRKPLPWVATGCRRDHMVSRASAVGCHPLREIPSLGGRGEGLWRVDRSRPQLDPAPGRTRRGRPLTPCEGASPRQVP